MIELTSPQGSIELAIGALLLVLGYRFVRPVRTHEWVSVAAYAVGLAEQLLGASGLFHGHVLEAGTALRLVGAALLVAGPVLAGTPARVRRRLATGAPNARSTPAMSAGHAGLALVLAGQFLRGPSTAGLVPVAVGILVNAGLALAARQPRSA